MATVLKKVIIVVAPDGLELSPTHRTQKPIQSIKFPYGKNWKDIHSVSSSLNTSENVSIEVYGLVGTISEIIYLLRWLKSIGLLSVTSHAFLIAITNRKQVAQIKGRSVYVVTGVVLIPLSSFAEAKQAAEQVGSALGSKAVASDDPPIYSDSSDEEGGSREVSPTGEIDDDQNVHGPLQETKDSLRDTLKEDSSIVQDVIGKKGQYGRFAERWFSRRGWSVDRKRLLGMSTGSNSGDLHRTLNSGGNPDVSEVATESQKERQRRTDTGDQPNVALTLLPKLLRTTKMLLNSESFYFSYDMDITRRLGTQETSLRSEIPLHKVVDPLVRTLSSYTQAWIAKEPIVLLESAPLYELH